MDRYRCNVRVVITPKSFLVVVIGAIFLPAISAEYDGDTPLDLELLRSKLKETEDKGEFYKHDPFMSYLNWPRLHFMGHFQADPATVNNDVRNYDMSNFTSWNASPMPNGNGQWNPKGTGAFRLMGGQVTSVCYVTGLCLSARGLDPIIGSSIQERGQSTSAKMVDLDPQSMDTSMIYGWKIGIGNYVTADFTPVPLTYLWKKMQDEPTVDGDGTLGASYQSSLTTIQWLEGGKSSIFIRQLRRTMDACGSKQLSIRFHLDMFKPRGSNEHFMWGRIAGTIGVLGDRTPLTASPGRNLEAMNQIVRDAPFVVDRLNRKMHIDFGNSLPVRANGSNSVKFLGALAVGFSPSGGHNCSSDFDWLGIVPYRSDGWYKLTAGVQSFPKSEPLSPARMQRAAESPFVVAEVHGTWPAISCKRVLLREPQDGILIRPQGQWVFRRDAMEPVQFELFVTKFGEALRNSPVIIGTASRFLQNLTKHLKKMNHYPEPELDVPPLRLPRMPTTTNETGIASVLIDTQNPENSRKIIDGQVYRISYNIPYHPPKKEYVIRVLVWDSFDYQSPPNWKDHVYPIFKLYANLYPVMTRDFIDLGNFEEVVENRRLIRMAMSLPEGHPNYMPVSRDLSSAKKKMIIEWLSQRPPLYDCSDRKSEGISPYISSYRSNYKEIINEPNQVEEIKKAKLERSPNPRNLGENASARHGRRVYRTTKTPLHPYTGHDLDEDNSTFFLKADDKSHILSSKNPGVLAKYYSLEQLKHDLQTALELEHATIPPYLTALVSIKEDYNKEVKDVLNTILVQEMLHMALVSNLLNAVGGKPSLTHKGFILNYPSALPGAVQQDVFIPLEKISKNLIKEVFMKIEEPTLTVAALEDRRLISEDVEKHLSYERHQSRVSNKRSSKGTMYERNPPRKKIASEIEENDYYCLKNSFPSATYGGETIFKRHKNTIGTFYNHILKTIAYLTKCGKDEGIFVGNPEAQLTTDHWYARDSCGHGKVIKVTDYSSAVAAIKEIVEEGEGSSPCMPAAGSPEISDLSHYFAFYSLYTGRVVSLRDRRGPEQPRKMSYNELVWWKVCRSIYTFDGDIVRFEPEGVWPLLPNARLTSYVPWSRPYLLSHAFSSAYTKLLKSLEHAFNGNPDDIKDAIGLMFSVFLHAKKLVQTPIDPKGSSEKGPNAAPTF